MKKLLTALICGLLMTGTANAEVVTYEGVGQYLMSDFETPEVAKLRAQQRAEKSAQEKAGIFVKSNTKVVNMKLESEEVEVMTAGIMKVHSVTYDVQTDPQGFIFTSKVLVDIDTAEIDKWLEKSVVEKEQLIEQNKSLQKTLAEQEKQLAELKAKLATLENVNPSVALMTKMQLTGGFAQSNNSFVSAERLKDGMNFHSRGDLNSAIQAYTDAISLNPNNTAALVWRGNAFGSLQNYQSAIMDFSRAVQLGSNDVNAYVGLGIAFYSTGAYAQAISALNSAIQIDGNNGKAYYTRAACFRAIGRNAEALQDEATSKKLGYSLR